MPTLPPPASLLTFNCPPPQWLQSTNIRAYKHLLDGTIWNPYPCTTSVSVNIGVWGVSACELVSPQVLRVYTRSRQRALQGRNVYILVCVSRLRPGRGSPPAGRMKPALRPALHTHTLQGVSKHHRISGKLNLSIITINYWGDSWATWWLLSHMIRCRWWSK